MGIIRTFSALNYISKSDAPVFEDMLLPLKREQINEPRDWLDFVWSLTVLERAQPKHYSSVLNNDFVKQINSLPSSFQVTANLKLSNINAAAELVTKTYDGPYLDKNSEHSEHILVQPKRKEHLIKALQQTLMAILPSDSYVNFDVNTKMGFLIDAEYYVNSDCDPIAPPTNNSDSTSIFRIAVMMYDYSHYYVNTTELIGIAVLHKRLLTAKGYQVIDISYKNFGLEDKIETRIAYLQERLKSLKETLSS